MQLMVTYLYLMAFFSQSIGDYWSERRSLVSNENAQMLGSNVELNKKERIVNEYLMNLKFSEFDEGFDTPSNFLPSRHFFQARRSIEKSPVFKFIRDMPKGGALHGHSSALLSFEGLYNITREKNLHACSFNDKLRLKFMLTPAQDPLCKWQLVHDLRKANKSYDNWLRSQLTLDSDNPRGTYRDINQVWSTFSKIFATVKSMITYRPVFEQYVYQALKELNDDRVMYAEIRGSFPALYELNGTVYTRTESAAILHGAVAAFQRDHVNFYGARYIYAPHRKVNNSVAKYYVDTVNELHNLYPNFILGFDLVGQEDKGDPLFKFIEILQSISKNVSLVFHAAETNWYGTSSDFNLFDAVLLGTKRIGHGFGLTKHPHLMRLIKEKNIAIEVCPISNQVLMLVQDLRNHPAAFLIGRGFPIVVSYDDPTFWSSKGLSYDFYMMFMGIASRNADLKLLKKLAENSLTYSLLPEREKAAVIKQWNKMWNEFIDLAYRNILNYGKIWH
ncbi:hypothetical protein PPYR_14917 [Photinus pyralis]|nr:hypothetical protein PPYR_14917 [Photinus pyralis]